MTSNLTLYSNIDELLAEEFSSLKVACKAGCHWCCAQFVSCSTPEAKEIAEFLLTLPNYAEIKEKLIEAVTEIRDQGSYGFFKQNEKRFCAFLTEDKTCGVYEVRPLSCRTYLSPKVASCRKAYKNTTRKPIVHQQPIDKRLEIITRLNTVGFDFGVFGELQVEVLLQLKELENESGQ